MMMFLSFVLLVLPVVVVAGGHHPHDNHHGGGHGGGGGHNGGGHNGGGGHSGAGKDVQFITAVNRTQPLTLAIQPLCGNVNGTNFTEVNTGIKLTGTKCAISLLIASSLFRLFVDL